MDKHEIEEILMTVINGHAKSHEALSNIIEEPDFETACKIARSHISPSYDRGKTDLGDAWASLLKDVKIHAINHLDDADKMTFISKSLG